MNTIRQYCFLIVTLCSLAFLTACGGGAADNGLGGWVRINGSSTIYPITQAVAEEFREAYPNTRVTVGVSGTGGGFAKFVRGEIDINDASRPIMPPEIELARQAGIEFIELPVAYDGLAVVVNPANDWVECLTTEELRQIWKPDSEVETWSDIRPEWPDEPIHLYGPGTASGTYDYFTQAIVGESGASRTDFTASEDDNVLVQGVIGDKYALGFFGLAYYESNADRLKLVGINDLNPNNGEGCIKPTAETVANGTYQPLSRPLFIYVNAVHADNPALDSFVDFYINNVGDLVAEVGFIPLSNDAYDLVLARFNERITGTLFEDEGDLVGVNVEQLLRQAQGPVQEQQPQQEDEPAA